ncbi:hypothetical protein D9M69_572230 [compost metagenome]
MLGGVDGLDHGGDLLGAGHQHARPAAFGGGGHHAGDAIGRGCVGLAQPHHALVGHHGIDPIADLQLGEVAHLRYRVEGLAVALVILEREGPALLIDGSDDRRDPHRLDVDAAGYARGETAGRVGGGGQAFVMGRAAAAADGGEGDEQYGERFGVVHKVSTLSNWLRRDWMHGRTASRLRPRIPPGRLLQRRRGWGIRLRGILARCSIQRSGSGP